MVAGREKEHALDEIREAASRVEFPATKDTLRDAAGDARVPLPGGRLVRLTVVLDRVGAHDFGTREDFEILAGRAWDRLTREEEKSK